jgi:hypothetical protein
VGYAEQWRELSCSPLLEYSSMSNFSSTFASYYRFVEFNIPFPVTSRKKDIRREYVVKEAPISFDRSFALGQIETITIPSQARSMQSHWPSFMSMLLLS